MIPEIMFKPYIEMQMFIFFQDRKTTGGVHDHEMLDPGNTTSRVARDVPDHDAGDSSPLSVFAPC